MESTRLNQLRDLLMQRLDDIRLAESAVHAGRRGVVRDASDDDRAAPMQRTLDELNQVGAALHRLDVGAYGHCMACRRSISLRRLMARPETERCEVCQSRPRSMARPRASAGH